MNLLKKSLFLSKGRVVSMSGEVNVWICGVGLVTMRGLVDESAAEILMFFVSSSCIWFVFRNPPKKPSPYFLSTPQTIKGPFSGRWLRTYSQKLNQSYNKLTGSKRNLLVWKTKLDVKIELQHIHQGDSISKKLDLTVYQSSQEKRDCKEIITLLQMTQCGSSKNSTG